MNHSAPKQLIMSLQPKDSGKILLILVIKIIICSQISALDMDGEGCITKGNWCEILTKSNIKNEISILDQSGPA